MLSKEIHREEPALLYVGSGHGLAVQTDQNCWRFGADRGERVDRHPPWSVAMPRCFEANTSNEVSHRCPQRRRIHNRMRTRSSEAASNSRVVLHGAPRCDLSVSQRLSGERARRLIDNRYSSYPPHRSVRLSHARTALEKQEKVESAAHW